VELMLYKVCCFLNRTALVMPKCMKRSVKLAIVLAYMVFAQQSAAQASNSVDTLAAQDARLAAVSARMLAGNSHLCRRHMPITGLVLHSSDQYRGGAAGHAFRNGEVAVEAVVPGSVADISGIKVNDGISAIAGQPFTTPGGGLLRDSAYSALAELADASAIEITITREGAEKTISFVAPTGCRALVEVLSDRGINARSDGRVIQVSYGLAEAANDSELAVIFAHEMGHLVLEHRRRLEAEGVQKGFLGEFGKNRRLNRQVELEADRIAVHLLANAGYDPGIAASFWRTKLGRRAGGGILRSGIYPSPEARAALSEKEIAEHIAGRERPSNAEHLMALRDQPFD
jgi:hypothetical protein